MKSIQLEIAASETDKALLHWSAVTPGKAKIHGTMRIEAEDDAARFIACAAKAFQALELFKEVKAA